MRITKKQLIQIQISEIRKEKVKQGYFDGRFKTTSIKNKKAYTRKDKHKNVI